MMGCEEKRGVRERESERGVEGRRGEISRA